VWAVGELPVHEETDGSNGKKSRRDKRNVDENKKNPERNTTKLKENDEKLLTREVMQRRTITSGERARGKHCPMGGEGITKSIEKWPASRPAVLFGRGGGGGGAARRESGENERKKNAGRKMKGGNS